MIDAPDSWVETLIRLTAAVACGAALGWERESKGRPAGLRTHMLVALGAAGFTVVGFELASLQSNGSIQSDSTRVISAVVTGIGFIGAGTIIHAGDRVKGLTTAASLWTCAAIGCACGAALFQTAAILTGLSLVILTAFQWIEKAAKGREPMPPVGRADDRQGA